MLSLAHVTLATHRHHVHERLLALGDTFLLYPVGLCFPVEATAPLACRWFDGLRVSQIVRKLNGASHRGQMTQERLLLRGFNLVDHRLFYVFGPNNWCSLIFHRLYPNTLKSAQVIDVLTLKLLLIELDSCLIKAQLILGIIGLLLIRPVFRFHFPCLFF